MELTLILHANDICIIRDQLQVISRSKYKHDRSTQNENIDSALSVINKYFW
jgi:hypothetical protein